ncbi:DUF4345 family protein [Dawidia soli]|uniref:DUF4345 family protein n=1 Tax=Dawidia soli TaxID=2782352 RepID=A0AAP2D639_9BACT|nr:DUF4345 family protein [Dawidia soli]MBT1686013.1 DUF4345 family protein [Dawidia soli]
MKTLSYFLFYTYVGLVIVAGFWGAFVGPRLDHVWLFHLDTNTLPEYSRVNLISQYRFLRALELGYGLFAVLFTKEIFTHKTFNGLFLLIMFSGVLARGVSLIIDGSPSWLFYFFLIYELLGVVVIYLYTRKTTLYYEY